MNIKEKKQGDVAIYCISGEIDITTSPDVRKVFDRLVKEKASKIVLNLSEVNYIDSSGLATLVEGLQRLKVHGGKMRLTNLSGKVKSLFEITKLERLFEIFPEEAKALEAFV